MAFRFSLDAVLRFRESLEHSEEAALLRIVHEITEAEQELGQINAEQIHIREQRERDLALKLPASHLRDIAIRELELKTAADKLGVRLRQLETQRLAQLAVYQTARQERQVLSELREQHHRTYQLEQKRKDQRTLDALFLTRSRRRD
jgi:flagellar export protein FliJ